MFYDPMIAKLITWGKTRDEAADLQVAARVLRPGGQVAVVAHEHDQRIPWVRKLANAVRIPGAADPLPGMTGSPYFGHPVVETFRFWQVVTRDGLAEVVRGLPTVLARSHSEQERAVSDALDLYDDYGRGPDGTGDFAVTSAPTKGSANTFAGVSVPTAWPGGPDEVPLDDEGTFTGDLSGLDYEPTGTATPGTLWAVQNGDGLLYRIVSDGAGG